MPRTAHTVTFRGAGTFPPTTIAGSYSARHCALDARALVGEARAFYAHSTGKAPPPADLYYFELRLAYAHFEADGCPVGDLAGEMKRALTARQRTFLLHNAAGDLDRAFHAALATS